MQLVQLQKALARFREHGLGVAAITYDNAAILKEFAQLHQVEYSLMADPQSEIIRSFGIVDPDENPNNLPGFAKKGMAIPGYFYVDRGGVVKEKYFGDVYYDRFTPNNLLGELFPELMETAGSPVAAAHLQFVTRQSDRDVMAGNRVTLGIEITLPRGMHVYAPGATKYKPVELVIDSIDTTQLTAKQLKALRYPRAKVMLLPAIKERVPVYEGRFSISQDVVILPPKEVRAKLNAPDTKPETTVNIIVHGRLKYQACDATTCFLPAETPITWELRMHPLDGSRASESIRDKRN